MVGDLDGQLRQARAHQEALTTQVDELQQKLAQQQGPHHYRQISAGGKGLVVIPQDEAQRLGSESHSGEVAELRCELENSHMAIDALNCRLEESQKLNKGYNGD